MKNKKKLQFSMVLENSQTTLGNEELFLASFEEFRIYFLNVPHNLSFFVWILVSSRYIYEIRGL